MNSFSKDRWDALAVEWCRTRRDRLWRDHSDAVNRALLARWLPIHSFRRLLKTDLFDEAVGDGLDESLHTYADTVVGMDISDPTVNAARESGAKCLMVGADVRALPMASGTFDVVFSNSTLDHFQTWNELVTALSELHRVLKDGGQLLLTIDNRANPAVGLRNLLPFKTLKRVKIIDYYVGTTCGPRRLQQTLAQVGFEVHELEAILHCPRIVCVWISRWLQKRGSSRLQQGYLRWLMQFERLARWPTRFLTGYFVAVRAQRLPRSRPIEGAGTTTVLSKE